MKRMLFTALLATILLLVLGCGATSGQPTDTPAPRPPAAPTPTPALFPKPSSAPEAMRDSYKMDTGYLPQNSSVDRMIVRTINMTALVNDVPRVLEQLSLLAEDIDGFVVSSFLQGEEERTRATITIRVPTERTEEALSRIRGMAVRVDSEQSQSQDVTEEYVDLQSRLRNLEAAEAQYLAFLERADSVEDLLNVQNALTNVHGQIEQIKGRKQYLERTSSTSLITVQLLPASSPGALIQPGWSPRETTKSAIRGLSAFGQGLANAAIRVGIFAPVWLPLLALASLLAWIAVRTLRRLIYGHKK